jgi:hypothetical protein
VDIPLDGCVEQVGLRNNYLSSPLFSLSFSIFNRILLNGLFFIAAEGRYRISLPSDAISEPDLALLWH